MNPKNNPIIDSSLPENWRRRNPFQPAKRYRLVSIKSAANFVKLGWLGMMICSWAFFAGCGTTTNRVATEQLLMSDAVDRAIAQIDFSSLEGKKVYLDTLYLHSVKGIGFVNSEYVISSLRQQLTAARCLIQDARETADVVVEPRVGALGTDGNEIVYGLPQSGAISSAANALASIPMPSIPEISFGKSNSQSGIAKIIVYAYDRETREPVWQSGIAKAESTSKDAWVLGAGPFQKGSIYEGMRFAGKQIPSHGPPAPEESGAPAVDEQTNGAIYFDECFVFATEGEKQEPLDIVAPLKPHQSAADKNEQPGVDSNVRPASHSEPTDSE